MSSPSTFIDAQVDFQDNRVAYLQIRCTYSPFVSTPILNKAHRFKHTLK